MRRFWIFAVLAFALVAGGLAWMRYAARTEPLGKNAVPDFVAPATPAAVTSTSTKTTVTQNPIALRSGKTFVLNAPSDLQISVGTQGFRHVRFMTKSPDNRLFVGEMTSASDQATGRVLAFDGFSTSTGSLTGAHVYLGHLRNPNSVTFYTDPSGKTWLYIATTDKLVRYEYHDGDTVPSSPPEVIAQFPTETRPWSAGGGHITRTVTSYQNKIYVSVGSSCNSCEERVDEPQRASIMQMDPDGKNQHVIASGLRNAVGIRFVDGKLYATDNGVDHLGPSKPNDLFYQIAFGSNYGWPFCYETAGKMLTDTTQTWTRPFDCSTVPLPISELSPHSAPLGFDVFGGTFLVAEHGSGIVSTGNGYKVVSLSKSGNEQTDFITGFLKQGKVYGRPVDILVNDANSFFITDDLNGAIYAVQKRK